MIFRFLYRWRLRCFLDVVFGSGGVLDIEQQWVFGFWVWVLEILIEFFVIEFSKIEEIIGEVFLC